jgi:RNA polymerase sigma factor (sigma-70 family)
VDTIQIEADAQLLKRFVEAQDEDAFRAIVERHATKVYSCCLRVLGDAHAADDGTQAVFLLLARKARRLPPETVLAGWLYRTASWTAVEARRTLAIRGRHEREAAAQRGRLNSAVADEAATENLRVQLSELLAALPVPQRDAIVLHFLDGRPEAEIAAELGCASSTVGTRISRGLSKLRDGLQRRGFTLATPFIPSLLSQLAKHPAPQNVIDAIRLTAPGQTTASVRAAEIAAHSARAASRLTLKTVAGIALGSIALLGAAGYTAHRITTPPPPMALTSAAYSPEIRDPKVLWEVTLEGTTPSHLIANSFVLLNVHAGEKQWLESRRISDGERVWTCPSGGTLCSVAGDIVVCSSGADIFAVQLSNGVERWRWHGTDTRRRSPVIYDKGEVFAVAAKSNDKDCSVCCLEATTGQTLWEAPAAVGPVTAAPSVDAEHVYVTGDGGVACVSRSEQRVLWSQNAGAKMSPVSSGGRVIVPGKEITSLGAANGAWGWSLPGHLENAAVTVAPDALLTGLQRSSPDEANPNGSAFTYAAIDPANGKIQWERAFPAEVRAGAAVTNNYVYLTCWDDGLYCLDRATGANVWRLSLPLNRWSPTPLLAPDRMLVCFQNKIFCIGNK